jgi:hypothetical protein
VPDEIGEDGRMQALVERIQQACAGEEPHMVTEALIEELCEALLRTPSPQRQSTLEYTLCLIRQYVEEG